MKKNLSLLLLSSLGLLSFAAHGEDAPEANELNETVVASPISVRGFGNCVEEISLAKRNLKTPYVKNVRFLGDESYSREEHPDFSVVGYCRYRYPAKGSGNEPAGAVSFEDVVPRSFTVNFAVTASSEEAGPVADGATANSSGASKFPGNLPAFLRDIIRGHSKAGDKAAPAAPAAPVVDLSGDSARPEDILELDSPPGAPAPTADSSSEPAPSRPAGSGAAAGSPAATPNGSPDWASLKKELGGFAYQTTGGLKGKQYQVTSNADYDPRKEKAVPGTLRYGIEVAGKSSPIWITFGDAFKKPQVISPKAPFNLNSNSTIDGRGRDVTISRAVNWALYQEKKNGSRRSECEPKPGVNAPAYAYMQLNNVQNVVITNLKFSRSNFENPAFGDADHDMDKQCLGDIISIYNRPGGSPIDNIWLNHLTIEKCGDGCVDMVRPSVNFAHRISISNSRFVKTDKTMIAGTHFDLNTKDIPAGKYPYRISMYGNYFDRANERNPRGSHSLIHLYNNYFDSWGMYIAANDNARIFVERNLLNGRYRAGDNGTFRYFPTNTIGKIFLFENSNRGGDAPGPDQRGYEELRDKWITYPQSIRTKLSPADFKNAGWTLN